MSPSKKTSTPQTLQRRRTTQLIFTFTLIIILFSFIIFQNFSLTSTSFTPLTEPTPSSLPTATSHLISTSNYISSLSSIVTPLENPPKLHTIVVETGPNSTIPLNPAANWRGLKKGESCDVFDGNWVLDDSDPVYPPGSCPFLDYTFNCFNNGRSDIGYLRFQWKPHGCDIPRFDGKKMLEILRGKRMAFVGDSLNRNMWESLVCSLRMSLIDKSTMFEVSGRRQFKTEGFYSFRFKDYNSSIDFIRSPFLVHQLKIPSVKGFKTRREMLRLDLIQATTCNYHNADFIIFNTGHWWTHNKTRKGKNFFQEGDIVHSELNVTEAYTKALKTWASWVDKNVNKTKTQVFFAGYSASHYRGGQWNSGGNCDGETEPITNDEYLTAYPWMMKTLESVITKMKTPVVYLNITKMTDYRKDGHPSIYRLPGAERRPGMTQDCSHWCLPGVPDSWNQLLYASLLMSSKRSNKTH